MRTTKLSIAGGILGALVIVLGIIRYLIIYDDIYKFLVCFAIGSLLLLFSYIYNFMRYTGELIDSVRNQADAIASKVFGLEDETIEEMARRRKGLD